MIWPSRIYGVDMARGADGCRENGGAGALAASDLKYAAAGMDNVPGVEDVDAVGGLGDFDFSIASGGSEGIRCDPFSVEEGMESWIFVLVHLIMEMMATMKPGRTL